MPSVAGTLLIGAFVTPALFWGGAAAVSAPILIHLLARRRFQRIRWAAMEFLIDAERRNRRRLRMEEWIILALRCLAVLLLGALVARPFFRPTGVAAVLGGSQRSERVFVLDDSLSMSYQTSTGTVFERAQDAVRRLVAAIREHTPDDTVTIVRMSAPDSPIDVGTYLDDRQAEELLERLDAMSPTYQAVNPSRVIESVVDILERTPGMTNVAIYIISDFQRHDWVQRDASATPDARTSAIMEPLIQWAGEDRSVKAFLVDVSQDDPANLTVTDLRLRGGQLVAGAMGTLQVSVVNHAESGVDAVTLQLTVGDFPQESKTVGALAPHQHASVELRATFVRPGYESLRVELPPDNLPGDNVRFAAADVASAVRVLAVNGEPSSDGFDDELTFLTTALRPEGEVFSGNEVVVVDEAELETTAFDAFHVVVLANVYRIAEPVVESLERFVSRGGGLIIYLGDQVDPELYNSAFYRDGAGLLPAALTEQIRPAEPAHLIVVDRLHAAMRGLSIEGDPLGIGQIPFFRFFGCEPFVGDATEDADAITPRLAGTNTAPARVVARFDDAGETPAIVERAFGQGRVILVTTTADKEWHAWPDHPTFLPITMELVRHVTQRNDTGVDVWAGEPILLPVALAEFEPDAIVRTPAYPDEREVGLTAESDGDGDGLVFRWNHTASPGVYRFLLKRRKGGEAIRLVAVNVDPREGDLSSAEEIELRSAMGTLPFEYVKGLDALNTASSDVRVEFWRWFLFAAAGVLMFEQFLAWFWGRRR